MILAPRERGTTPGANAIRCLSRRDRDKAVPSLTRRASDRYPPPAPGRPRCRVQQARAGTNVTRADEETTPPPARTTPKAVAGQPVASPGSETGRTPSNWIRAPRAFEVENAHHHDGATAPRRTSAFSA